MAIIGNIAIKATGDPTGAADAMAVVRQDMKSLVSEFDRGIKAHQSRLNEWARENERIKQSVLTQEERLAARFKDLDQRFGTGGISTETYKRAIQRLREEHGEVAKLQEATARAQTAAVNVPVRVGVLEQLKTAFGGRSDAKEVLEVLRGGGAAVGLSIAGQTLRDFTQELISLRDEANKGDLAFGQMVERVAGSLPVFGSIWQAGRNIRELFTGEDGINRGILEAAQRADAFSAAMKEAGQSIMAWQRQTGDRARDVERQGRDLRLRGFDRDFAQVRDGYTDSMANLKREYEDRDSGNEQVKALREQLALARKAEQMAGSKSADADQSLQYAVDYGRKFGGGGPSVTLAKAEAEQAKAEYQKRIAERERIEGAITRIVSAAAEERSKSEQLAWKKTAMELGDVRAKFLVNAIGAGLTNLSEQWGTVMDRLSEESWARFNAGRDAAEQSREMMQPWDALADRIKEINFDFSHGIITRAEQIRREAEAQRKYTEYQQQRQKAEADAGKQQQEQTAALGKQLREEVMTPEERYKEKLQQLNDAYLSGAINDETFRRQYAKITKDAYGSNSSGLAVTEVRGGPSQVTGDPILEKQLAQGEEQLKELKKISEGIDQFFKAGSIFDNKNPWNDIAIVQ